MVAYAFILAGFCVLIHEFRQRHVGRAGWLLVLISALFGYELIFQQNFGKLAVLILIGVGLYAWRNWFFSLCACLILMAFIENHDTPKGMLGIHGLNPWNYIMANVLFSWWIHRRREGLSWDMPRHVTLMILCALFVVVWSFLRMTGDFEKLDVLNASEYQENHQTHYTLTWITSDYLINCVKWLLPAALLYDGCRTRTRIYQALATVLTVYLVIAFQVNHCMPFGAVAADGTKLARIAAKDLDRTIGYFRTEISMMLAGASWGMLCCTLLVKERRYQIMMILAAATALLGQALTGGRAGYVTWALTGIVLGLVRWRKALAFIPVVVIIVCLFLPAVRDRMLQGIVGGSEVNVDVMTSGRNIAWAHVIPKIWESPVIGWGRQAMIRTGIYEKLMNGVYAEGETFPHPHNAYLECLLDNGLVGFFLMMPIYLFSLVQSLRILRDKSDPIYAAIGGVSAALILGLLFGSMGSQSFYPKESSVGMWAAIALMLRVWEERKRSWETGEPLFGEEVEGTEQANTQEEEPAMENAMPAWY